MISEESSETRTATIVQHGLESAADDGSPKVRASHLTNEELEELVALMLEYLRTRSGTPSHIEGWQKVSSRKARVVPWWKEIAKLSESEHRRLPPLRDDVYDLLIQRGLLEKEPGTGTPIHVSPEGYQPETAGRGALEGPEPQVQPRADFEGGPEAAPPVLEVGAWVLKGSPHVYDLNLVFMNPSRLLRKWAVEIPARAAEMQPGQQVYFWVGDGDPYRAPGIWGAGKVTGRCSEGTPGEGWLDAEAAARATVFARVKVVLWELPVLRETFLADPRLATAEVVRDPWSGNPSYLTPQEAAALAEHLA